MNRRDAVLAIGALALAACTDATGVVEPETEYKLSVNVYVHCGFQTPRPEFGKVPGVQCPWPNAWDVMRERGKLDRIPAIGEYDEGDPAVTQYYLTLMEYAGIDCAVYQIEIDHRAILATMPRAA